MEYEAFLESGTRVLGSTKKEPLVFRFGSGEIFHSADHKCLVVGGGTQASGPADLSMIGAFDALEPGVMIPS